LRPKALILLASRPESVEIAVREMRPELLAVIVLQEVLGGDDARSEEVLQDLSQKRNRFIVARGLKLIDGDAALRFLEDVDGFVTGSEARSPAAHTTLKGL
jgi:hypothetical protein